MFLPYQAFPLSACVEQISFSCGFHRKPGAESSLLGIQNLKLLLLSQSILLLVEKSIGEGQENCVVPAVAFLSHSFEPFPSSEAHKPGFQQSRTATSSDSGFYHFEGSF